MNRKVAALAATSLIALSLASRAMAVDIPTQLRVATDLGPADTSQIINITVQLRLPDYAAFSSAVDALYDPASPTFRHWMTDADLRRFAPAPAEIAAVRAELESHGLTVVSADADGFSLRARGPLGSVARAFNTDIHRFSRGSETFRANIGRATLSGPAAAYVSNVAGLESRIVHPMLARAINPKTGQPYPNFAIGAVLAAGGLSSKITDVILSPSKTVAYTTPGQPLPTAQYTGVEYGANSQLTPDFDAHQVQKLYHLDQAYKQGLDGTGQTIVLLEAYGYPEVLSDANLFNKLNGLPMLDGTNFSVVYPEGVPSDPGEGTLLGWNLETALDVQWAHATAPGAKIVVVATNGQDNEDFVYSMQYIVDQGLANSVSDSWEVDTDLVAGPAEQQAFENVLVVAAAKGVSFQFSTGDSGDHNLGSPLGAAGVPSVAPHATAVGGTSALNNVGGHGYKFTGWGNSLTFLYSNGVEDPPFGYFRGGAGGGESTYWPKPAWQQALPGLGRQTPDVSALADPFTGVPVVFTNNAVLNVAIGYGGTSLASPIFSAIWAIANQKARHPLGQAAPTIALLKTGLIDVIPFNNKANLTGSITDASGTTNYDTNSLFVYNNLPPGGFVGTLWDQPQFGSAAGLSFGTDSSLTVTTGWDNVTGYGTPDGLAFIDAAAGLKH